MWRAEVLGGGRDDERVQPRGTEKEQGLRQEGLARGEHDAQTLLERVLHAAGAREIAPLFYCYLAICWEVEMLKRRVKKSWEEAGFKARLRGRLSVTLRWVSVISRQLRALSILSLQDTGGLHFPPGPKASMLGVREPAFQAWGPHREQRAMVRPPSSRLGPAARALAHPGRPQLLPGRGGVGGEEAAGPRTAVLPEGT